MKCQVIFVDKPYNNQIIFFMKKQTYNFVLSPGIKKALEVAAQKDRRSMSSLIEKIIVDYLEKEGIPWTNGIIEDNPIKTHKPNKAKSK